MQIAEFSSPQALVEEAEKLKYTDREKTALLAEQALSLTETEIDIAWRIRALILSAYCHHHKSESETFFRKIYQAQDLLTMAPDPFQLSYVKYLLACAFRNLSDYDTSAQSFLESLELAEEIGDTEGMVRSLNGLGHLYNILGNRKKAQELFVKGLAEADKLNISSLFAQLLGNQAATFIAEGNLKDARTNLERVLEIYSEAGDRGGIGLTRSRLAKLCIQEGHTDRGLNMLMDTFNQAIENKILMAVVVLGSEIASILINLGRLDAAKPFLDKSYETAETTNFLLSHKTILECYFKYYKGKQDFTSALEWHEKLFELSEKLHSQQTEAKLKNADILNEIKFVKKQAEIENQKHLQLRAAYEEIEIKNKEITDSIHYARRIQNAMLPSEENLKNIIPAHFLLSKPRDIVSGDFYWASAIEKNNVSYKIIAVADCTGHGVPGALMSMICSTLLAKCVAGSENLSPSQILDSLDRELCRSLNQSQNQSHDGMDIALCIINSETNEMIVSSAMRSVLIWSGKEKKLNEILPTKRAIGNFSFITPVPFIDSKINLAAEDRVFMFTDGFADQFGGPKGKKMMVKNFKHLLNDTSESKSLESQREILEDYFSSWKNNLEQVDDVTILGFSV